MTRDYIYVGPSAISSEAAKRHAETSVEAWWRGLGFDHKVTAIEAKQRKDGSWSVLVEDRKVIR